MPHSIYLWLLYNGWSSRLSCSLLRLSDALSDLFFMTGLFLWLVYCLWWWRPYISVPLLAVCFTFLDRLGVNPYEGSGYHMLIVAAVMGFQMWRLRRYLFWEMICYDDPELERMSRRWQASNQR